jgi:hypothetical protein
MGRVEGFGIEELTFACLTAGDTLHHTATGEFMLAQRANLHRIRAIIVRGAASFPEPDAPR